MKKPWLDEQNTEDNKLGGGLPPNSPPLFSACYLAVDRSRQWTSWHCANNQPITALTRALSNSGLVKLEPTPGAKSPKRPDTY